MYDGVKGMIEYQNTHVCNSRPLSERSNTLLISLTSLYHLIANCSK